MGRAIDFRLWEKGLGTESYCQQGSVNAFELFCWWGERERGLGSSNPAWQQCFVFGLVWSEAMYFIDRYKEPIIYPMSLLVYRLYEFYFRSGMNLCTNIGSKQVDSLRWQLCIVTCENSGSSGCWWIDTSLVFRVNESYKPVLASAYIKLPRSDKRSAVKL